MPTLAELMATSEADSGLAKLVQDNDAPSPGGLASLIGEEEKKNPGGLLDGIKKYVTDTMSVPGFVAQASSKSASSLKKMGDVYGGLNTLRLVSSMAMSNLGYMRTPENIANIFEDMESFKKKSDSAPNGL